MRKSLDSITENFLTIDLILEINNGYCISHQIPINFSSGFVLAYNTFKNMFVTWEYRIDYKETYCEISFFYGHYITNELKAKRDFYERVNRHCESIVDWYNQKINYNISNEIE